MDDQQALELAKIAALRGGEVALTRLGEPGYLTWKGIRDVVPEAAFMVQDAIVSTIRSEAPGDAVLAEEGPEDEPLDVDADRLWIVDPICGSLNFVHGVPFFAVSIALRAGGQLRVGVVRDPMRDETFAARIGEPATLNERVINVRTVPLGPEFWEHATLGTDLPRHGEKRKQGLRAFELLSNEVLAQNVMGSPALGLSYVAAGRLHVYWTFDAKPWDIAAAGVIVAQAGGLITDGEGGSWLHSEGSYVAANPASHSWALRSVKFVREQSQHPR